jgi:DNA-binding transcriptional LysR family regulator
LLRDRFVMVCRDDHPLAARRSLAWRQLEGHPLVFMGHVSGNRQLLELALGGQELRLQFRYEVQRSSTAVGLAAQGLGAAIVPALAIHKGAYPSLRVIALREPVVTRALALLGRRNASLSPAAAALYELVRSSASATP